MHAKWWVRTWSASRPYNPRVNAIVTLTAERALALAAEQDDLATRGEFAGPLHGLPMAHKDNHLTAGIRTTFGSPSQGRFRAR